MEGYFKVPNCLFDANLSQSEKLVLAYIYRCANNNKIAHPSYADIAIKCSITRRTAIRAIRSLVAQGFIQGEHHYKTNNTYNVGGDK